MSLSRPRPTDEEWRRHKPEIRRLYLVDDMELHSLVEHLGYQGFHVTSQQLQYKLKIWKIRKNIDKSTWGKIDRFIDHRKRKGKDSEVILSGRRVKPETVQKETDRHRDRSLFAKLNSQRQLSPVPIPADNQVSVCTPQPFSVDFEWPSTLPWLRFPANDLQTMLGASIEGSLGNKKVLHEALVYAPSWGNRLAPNVAQFGVSKLAAVIGTSMPESYPQEHLQRAQCLLTGSPEEYLAESLKILIYGLSNDTLDLERDAQWEATIDVLKASGLLKISANLKKLKSWTIDGFMENLYNAAMDRFIRPYPHPEVKEILVILRWLLSLGQSPIIPKDRYFWSRLGDDEGRLELLELLLQSGADANCRIGHRHPDERILEAVLNSAASITGMILRTAGLLLKYGAYVNLDRALHSSIRRWHRDLIEIILGHGGNISAEVECLDGLVCKETALSNAAGIGLPETRYIIDLLTSANPTKPICEFVTADVLISAAAKGNNETLRYLYSQSRVVVANDCGITPLHAAALHGHLRTCQLLFDLDVADVSNVTPVVTPIHLACHASHYDIVHFLVAKGADVKAIGRVRNNYKEGETSHRFLSVLNSAGNSVISLFNATPLSICFQGIKNDRSSCEIASCAIALIQAGAELCGSEVSYAVSQSHVDLLSAALGAGADPDAKGTRGDRSPLQQALWLRSDRNCPGIKYKIISLLLKHGATLQGGEVCAAVHRGRGDLVDLLLRCGATLQGGEVCAAVYRGHGDLVDFLLGCGAMLQGGEVYEAVCGGNQNIVALLLRCGATLKGGELYQAARLGNQALGMTDLLLKYGITPQGEDFRLAVCHREWDIVESLLEYSKNLLYTDNVETTASGWGFYEATSLCAAIKARHHPTIHELITSRGNKPVDDGWEVTAVGMAAEWGTMDLLRDLLKVPTSCKFGPMPYTLNRHTGILTYKQLDYIPTISGWEDLWGSPLALIASRTWDEVSEACSELLKNGFRPDRLTWAVAADSNNTAFAQYLLDHSHRYKSHNDYKHDQSNIPTPLIAAIKHHNKELVDVLLKAGMDVNEHMTSKARSRSPLQHAVELGDFEIVHCLIKAGADINSPPASSGGATALQLAAIKGYLGLARYLLDHGAQVNALPARYYGRTALEGAAEWGRLDMLELLVANGAEKTGKWHGRYVRAVKLAVDRGRNTAASFLKQSLGWSEEDENLSGTNVFRDIDDPVWDDDFFSEHMREESGDGDVDMGEVLLKSDADRSYSQSGNEESVGIEADMDGLDREESFSGETGMDGLDREESFSGETGMDELDSEDV
ncbi:ankyrin repeat-containing domain protein [Nemania sp. NC0429]|nr:ankyrin repeat-containing domain protein [Nemania sp. NC0429]